VLLPRRCAWHYVPRVFPGYPPATAAGIEVPASVDRISAPIVTNKIRERRRDLPDGNDLSGLVPCPKRFLATCAMLSIIDDPQFEISHRSYRYAEPHLLESRDASYVNTQTADNRQFVIYGRSRRQRRKPPIVSSNLRATQVLCQPEVRKLMPQF